MLLTVKGNQKTLHRQIRSQFQGKRHGRDTTWNLRANEAPDHIKENWPGSRWIIEVITSSVRKGKRGRASPLHHHKLKDELLFIF